MQYQLQELDKVKWTPQEDDLLIKLQRHFAGDYNQIAIQMNNIFFYQKMTAQLCEYRWKYYIDSSINRADFTTNEEHNMLVHLKKNDLYRNHFWFELQGEFQNRPPSVQKNCTIKFIHKHLSQLNDHYIQNKAVKKRYHSRIKYFGIDIIICFFRLGKERIKRSGPASLLHQSIEQCNQFILYLDQQIQTRGGGGLVRYDDQNEQSTIKFHQMMECLIFIDTIYRIRHKISPYNQGEQAERDKMESLLNKKQGNGQSDNDDQCFEMLNRDDVRLIYQSEVLQTFNQYFSSNE